MDQRRIHNFDEAQAALRPLYGQSRPGDYTLDNMRAIMQFLGEPQNKVRVVHVAGTSGKTSTSYYVAALLKASGKTVGLSVSPHVEYLNERLQINGTPLPEADFCAVLEEFLTVMHDCPVQPSYFEFMVAMAYWEFARRDLEYVVMEVGLGGLLDGTNVVDRADKICIITDIGLDHTEILGDTLTKIAAQKAGIIQPGNEVYMYEQGAEVMDVVRARVSEQGATLHLASAIAERPELPAFQKRNLGLAVAAVQQVADLTDEAIAAAAHIVVPARMEEYHPAPGQTLILDGSHNSQKIATLLDSIKQRYPEQKIAVLCGFVSGPNSRWQEALNELLPIADELIFTGFYSEKDYPKTSVDPQQLADYAERAARVIADPAEAFAALQSCKQPVLLVTGSFYLMNHIPPLAQELA